MVVTGYILDQGTGSGVPRATVELWSGNVMLARVAASDTGYFSINASGNGTEVRVTSVGYEPSLFNVSGSSFDNKFSVPKVYKEEEDVIITSSYGNQKSLVVVAVLAGLVLLAAINDRR